MTLVTERPPGDVATADVPRRLSVITVAAVAELVIPAVAAACLVGVAFALAGLGTGAWMGFVIC